MKEYKNSLAYPQKKILNTETQKELKEASNSYVKCFTEEFLPRFMKGEDVQVADFCTDQFDSLQTSHSAVYKDVL